jgi:hypothetical protein
VSQAHRTLVLLDAGNLIQLSEIAVPDIYGYYLVSSAQRPPSKALQTFANWLKTGIEASIAAMCERKEGVNVR